MPHYKKLIGNKCFLSPLTPEDAEDFAIWDNDLEVVIPLGDEAYTPMTLVKSQQQVNEAIRGGAHVFGILDLEGEQMIGRCMLFAIDAVNRCAMLGIVIGEKEFWNQGIGQEAVSLLLDYGFNLLNLNNINLSVFSFNIGAMRAYQKAGFREAGRLRQARIVGGQKYDVVMMDILAEEYQSVYLKGILPGAAIE